MWVTVDSAADSGRFGRARAQVVPVLHAFLLLVVVTAIYAVLANQLYRDRDPELFGRFSLALFTVRGRFLRRSSQNLAMVFECALLAE